MSVDAIVDEMASAVRFLGGDGPTKEQNNRAARAARLPVTVVERLRWRKNRRPFADIVDAVRNAVERHNEESLARAQHELAIARRTNASLISQLEAIDAAFHGPTIAALRRDGLGLGRNPGLQSGE